jgi:carboxyl-terminal processing protease
MTGLWAGSAMSESSTANEPKSVIQRLSPILDQIKARYVEPVDDNKLFTEAVNGLLRSLDPFSAYLDKEAFRELQQESQGKYGGLGIEVKKDGGLIRILSTFEDTPAYRAGLQPGDLITRLNESNVAELSLEQAIQQARGEPDTSLTLTLLREGEPGPRKMTLDRELIQGRSVKSSMIGPSYAYVRLTQFHRHSADVMAEQLERLLELSGGAIEGVVLDLRDNPGGALSAAVAVAAAFLPKDALVVYTNGMSEQSKMRFRANKDDYVRQGAQDPLERLPDLMKAVPLVVLVNGGSASASEIVAGALKDHKRGIILGTRTFGKGSIQVVIPLGDGTGMRLTTAHYYTPEGRRIDGKGVTPDVIIDQEPSAGVDAIAHAVAQGRLASAASADGQTSRVQCRQDLASTPQPEPLSPAIPHPQSNLDLVDCQLEHALKTLDRLSASRRN